MRGNEVIQDVALLLLQRRHHCHHALDKTRAVFALRAKATFAPLHTRTDGALSHIVGRLNALNLHERPQGLAALENLAAHPFGFGYPTLATDFEEALDLAAKRCPIGAKRRSLQGAFAHPMPPLKHLVCLLKQGLANLLGEPPTASNRFKIPQQMRPAQLTPPHRIPVVSTVAVGHQDTRKSLAQQL